MRLRHAVTALVLVFCGSHRTAAAAGADAQQPAKPNIVFILCDDLGWGDVGAFGQTRIRTPNIDRLAAEGMKLTAHYSGHNVCAPSRCVLLSGRHPGHACIRDNRGGIRTGREGQEPVPPGELRLPLLLKKLGYATGCTGKWGLGPVGSTGDPLNQGIDRFFGYNCQSVAHNYYPEHLWSNQERVVLDNPVFAAHQKFPADADPADRAAYDRYRGSRYSADLIAEEAREFVRRNRDRPFLLYWSTTVPHLALQVPEDSLGEYADAFPDETPYAGGDGYLPHPAPRAAYAAMITRLDREIGRLMELLDESGLRERTIVVFTSDNGPVVDGHGGAATKFFGSAGPFRGNKGGYYEGGFRVPCIVRWPEKVAPGSQSDRVTGFEDWLPTLLDLIGEPGSIPGDIDGISFAPTLMGQPQGPRPFLYREGPNSGGQVCVREGDWKLLLRNLHPRPQDRDSVQPVAELYNLAADPGEQRNVADQNPEIVDRLRAIAKREHVPSKLFPVAALDGADRTE